MSPYVIAIIGCTGEARRWLRSGRYSRKAVATPTPADSVRIAAEAAAEQERFDRLKEQLQTWCLGTALVCFGATVVFYSKVCCLHCNSSDLERHTPVHDVDMPRLPIHGMLVRKLWATWNKCATQVRHACKHMSHQSFPCCIMADEKSCQGAEDCKLGTKPHKPVKQCQQASLVVSALHESAQRLWFGRLSDTILSYVVGYSHQLWLWSCGQPGVFADAQQEHGWCRRCRSCTRATSAACARHLDCCVQQVRFWTTVACPCYCNYLET